VDQANLALQNGDYKTAVKLYESVLVQPITSVSPVLRAAAEYSAGVAALREGLFETAYTHFTAFINFYPDDPRIARVYFLRGEASTGLGTWDAAISDYQTYMLRKPGLLDSYAWERIGDIYLKQAKPTEALTAYAQAGQGTPRSLVPLLQLREKLATAYLAAGDTKSAVAQYDAILAVARNAPYRASIAYSAAIAYAKAGDALNATPRYQAIVRDYPGQPQAYQSMIALLDGGVVIDAITQGRVAYLAGDYRRAITALSDAIKGGATDPTLYLFLGRSYREAANFDAAISTFQVLIDQGVSGAFFGDAWLDQGRTLFLAGKLPEAISKYKELAQMYPTLPQSDDSLSRAAYLEAQVGNAEASLVTYEQLGKQYPNSPLAMDALFKAGSLAYNSSDSSRASQLFATLATNGTGSLKAAGSFWLGRIYQLAGDSAQARTAYTLATQSDPFGYYSQRAKEVLTGVAPLTPPTAYNWVWNDAANRASADSWMKNTFKLTESGELWRLSATLSSDPRKLRGDELWAVAAFDQARAEYVGLRDDYAQNPLGLYQLAGYFYEIGLYRESITTGDLLIRASGATAGTVPRYIGGLAYPIGYGDLVIPAAQKYGIDPLLVFSLIRQESLYESYARSFAAAQGLMQIIPDTGVYIAAKLQWAGYQNSDLYRPYLNVQFGTYYLKEQLDTFKGNKFAALAAYNAGPGASLGWVRIAGDDPDLFAQTIDYEETRTYVRRIYEQYQFYAAIFGN
jgi:soluble lytic murein transglycosylase